MLLIHRLIAYSIWALWVMVLPLSAQAACQHDTVHLRGDWGQARFSVEVADNAAERSKGLMGRPSMPSGAGMLFVYHRTKPVSFWMRNTLIPLDMIFLDEAGIVVRVHHNAIPLDETPISSILPARYVLEVNGGLSAALGIVPGSQLRHASILQHKAAWRCSEGD